MTKRAVVVGWPISHSRSPLIHNSWIAQHGLDARYDRYALEPSAAAGWFDRFANSGLVGANVTIPHKDTAVEACLRAGGSVSDHARRLGGVNTLWLEDGRLCGTSTDGEGFMAILDAGASKWQSHPLVFENVFFIVCYLFLPFIVV